MTRKATKKPARRHTVRPPAPVSVAVPALSVEQSDAMKTAAVAIDPRQAYRLQGKPLPKHVALIAMGASSADFVKVANGMGGSFTMADEIWTINATAAVLFHDRAFVMNDIKHHITKEAEEGKKIAKGILKWLPVHPGPVYTSTPYHEWPALVRYPLRECVQAIGGLAYLNTSVAYAIAFAMFLKVERLSLYGCDFTYPNAHVSESGRGCVEFLLGIACARGIKIECPASTTLLDANKPDGRRTYGYVDEVHSEIVDGKVQITYGPKPTATATDAGPTATVEVITVSEGHL